MTIPVGTGLDVAAPAWQQPEGYEPEQAVRLGAEVEEDLEEDLEDESDEDESDEDESDAAPEEGTSLDEGDTSEPEVLAPPVVD